MKELGATEVEDELWEQGEFPAHAEALWIVLLVFCKASGQLDKHTIKPADDVHCFLLLSHVHCVASDNDGRRFLIKAVGQVSHIFSC